MKSLSHLPSWLVLLSLSIIPAHALARGNQRSRAFESPRPTASNSIATWIVQKVIEPTAADGNLFGSSVALSGDDTTALIGAPNETINGHSNQGSAVLYKYTNGSWSLDNRIGAAGTLNEYQGASVALSADATNALIGAYGYNSAFGSALLFDLDNSTIFNFAALASGLSANDYLGYSVALSADGHTALVGAYGKTVNGHLEEGAAYVFTRDSSGTWAQTAELTPSPDAGNDYFGYSVALSADGKTALVGAYGENGLRGGAYLFSLVGGSWTSDLEFTLTDGATNDEFGISVALSPDGNTVLIGAPGRPGGGSGLGAAYVYTDTGGGVWSKAELTPGTGNPYDGFGGADAVALSGDGARAVVGAAALTVTGNTAQGATFVYDKPSGGWADTATPDVKLTTNDGAAHDLFGTSVAISDDGDTVLIGANQNGGSGQGKAYFYGISDLGLTVSSPTTAPPGTTLVSQAIATNASTYASPAVAVTMTVPAGADFVSADATQGSCSENSSVVTCNLGPIDGNGGTATASVTLKATAAAGSTLDTTASVARSTPALHAGGSTVIDTPPVASDGSVTDDQSTAVNGTLDASDADGNTLTFSIVSQPQHGTVSLTDTSTGAFTYTPNSGYSGTDGFTFKTNDGLLDSNSATESITVKAATSPSNSNGGGGGGGGVMGGLGLLFLMGSALIAAPKRRRGKT